MEFIKYTVFLYIFCTRQVFGICELNRNASNKYPFVLKLTVDGVIRCHGALITPKHFVAAYHPVKDIVDDWNLLPKLNVTGAVYGSNGQFRCSITRHPKKTARIWSGRSGLNLFVGELDRGFRVTRTSPFLYPNITDYDPALFEKHFAELTDFGCCVLPVFDSKTSEEAKILEDTAIYVKGETADYWRKAFCRNSTQCDELTRRDHFFAYSPHDISNDPSWYQGAMIICNDNPLGSLSMLIEDSASTKIAMFEHIKLHALHFKAISAGNWDNAATRFRHHLAANIFAIGIIIHLL